MLRTLFTLVPAPQRPLIPRYIAGLVTFVVAQAAAYLTIPPLLVALFSGDLGTAWGWTAVLAGTIVLLTASNYWHSMTGFLIGASMMRDLQTQLGDHISSLPLGWFTPGRSGRVSRTVSSNTMEITTLFAHIIAPLVTAIGVPVLVAVGMLAIDWRLAVAMIVTAPLLWLVNRWGAELYRRADERSDAAAAEANARVVEFAKLQPVLRSLDDRETGRARLDAALDEQRGAMVAQVRSIVPGGLSFSVLVQAAFVALVHLAITFALDGSVEPIVAVALFAITSRFIEPLASAAEGASALRASANAVARISELLGEPTLQAPAVGVEPRDSSVELRGVTFGYGEGVVIDDLTLEVPAGTTTALVGPSGSGKTTIGRLVARFYDVQSGEVLVGGQPVRDYDPATLLAQVSLVFQDVYLFDDTIRENIRLGRPGATDEEVAAAARAASVDEIVARLPEGWDTRVGEGGASLSGGERQRVSVARALLKDAPIVLLDEATSSLDPENEAAVVRGLRALTRGRTVIAIAHRLATVRHADQIAFLEQGRIVERGTHDELLALGGRYAAFWSERTDAAGWRLEPLS